MNSRTKANVQFLFSLTNSCIPSGVKDGAVLSKSAGDQQCLLDFPSLIILNMQKNQQKTGLISRGYWNGKRKAEIIKVKVHLI